MTQTTPQHRASVKRFHTAFLVAILVISTTPDSIAQWQNIGRTIKGLDQVRGYVDQLGTGLDAISRAKGADIEESARPLQNDYLAGIDRVLKKLDLQDLQVSPDMSDYNISVDDVNNPDTRCQAYELAQDAVNFLENDRPRYDDIQWRLEDLGEKLKRAELARGDLSSWLLNSDFHFIPGWSTTTWGQIDRLDGPIANTLHQGTETVTNRLKEVEYSRDEYTNLIDSYSGVVTLAERVAIDQGYESPCAIWSDDDWADLDAAMSSYRSQHENRKEAQYDFATADNVQQESWIGGIKEGIVSNVSMRRQQAGMARRQGEAAASQEGSRSTYNESSYSGQYGGDPLCPSGARYMVAGRELEFIREIAELMERNDRVCGTCVGSDGTKGYYCE